MPKQLPQAMEAYKWTPGQAPANPAGRPSLAKQFAESAKRCIHCGEPHSAADTIVYLMAHARRESVRLDAAAEFLDRVHGRPMQTHLVSEDADLLRQYAELPDAVLRTLMAEAQVLEGEATLLEERISEQPTEQ